MMCKKFILSVLFISGCALQAQDWTAFYQKTVSHADYEYLKHRHVLTFTKQEVKKFNQLLFSWNSVRPAVGYFAFYVQVRDAQTKKWGVLHHMADWGAGVQKSYSSKSDGIAHFVHVRLEVDKQKMADAFRIQVAPKDGASLAAIKNLNVSVADMFQFKNESAVAQTKKLTSVAILGVPLYSQFAADHKDARELCSPTSCAMVCRFLSKKMIKPSVFADKSFDQGLGIHGSWPFNTAELFQEVQGNYTVSVRRLNSFAQIHQQLRSKIPVIVSLRGTLPGAFKPFNGGHLLVVTGYDAKRGEVICNDPAIAADDRKHKRYPIASFLKAWEISRRLTYWIEAGPARKA